MKVLKKITILVLVVAMAFSVNVTGTFTESVKAATEFQITSDNGLVAAGYIDIKWNNPVGGSASKYNVYVDGNYVNSTTSTTYEYYTTSVAYHTAWIEAELSNGAKEYTKTVKFGVSKKGLAVNDNMGRRLDPVAMNSKQWL